MKISLAMIVKNEERFIKRCLDSVKSLVDEIIVVDTGSTDNTLYIIQEYSSVKLFHHTWNNNFSTARNFSLSQCSGDYVLVLDADEYVSVGDRQELEIIMKSNVIGRMKICSPFKKEGQTFTSNSYVSRFFPKELKYKGIIHEQLDSDLSRQKMNFEIEHSGYMDVRKDQRNIPLLLKALEQEPKDSYYMFQLGKEYRIVENYERAFHILNESYSLLTGEEEYYTDLVVEFIYSGKEIQNNSISKRILGVIEDNEEHLKKVADFHFAKGLFFLDYSLKLRNRGFAYLPAIEQSFLKCLQLENSSHVESVVGTGSFLAAYNLGVFYEVIGKIDEAEKYYLLSFERGYIPAQKRLNVLKVSK
ncbi:glycosyltransferase family 2 protein [Priestia megaterium]|uniref:glycosyltransferase family 2 protein n=1 Tax=Priestia megaterium TaxID=1404 RepID=UPI0007625156|nr:glycosyltransferase family 2 protein [Priestia megaterium]KWU59171.1 hypothetical protein AWX17_22080 [Priestia megaterium]